MKDLIEQFVDINNKIRESTASSERATFSSAKDVSPMQLRVLQAVGVHEDCTVNTIAKAVSLTPGSITQIVDKLVAKKYVKRERSKTDRRVVYVRHLVKGQKIYAMYQESVRDVYRGWLEKISPAEARSLINIFFENNRVTLTE